MLMTKKVTGPRKYKQKFKCGLVWHLSRSGSRWIKGQMKSEESDGSHFQICLKIKIMSEYEKIPIICIG